MDDQHNHVNPGHNKSFDQFGDYQKRTVAVHQTIDEQFFDPHIPQDPKLFFFDADSFNEQDQYDNIHICMELELTPNNVTIASKKKRSESGGVCGSKNCSSIVWWTAAVRF